MKQIITLFVCLISLSAFSQSKPSGSVSQQVTLRLEKVAVVESPAFQSSFNTDMNTGNVSVQSIDKWLINSKKVAEADSNQLIQTASDYINTDKSANNSFKTVFTLSPA